MDKKYVINVAKKYSAYIRQKFKIQSVFLFGSYTNNKFHKESDIDIAVVFDKLTDNFAMQQQLMRDRRSFDTRIEPHIFENKEFSKNNPLALQILKNGIKII